MGANSIYKAVTDGCALIGDAAHITSPAGGHGMNLVINDKSSEAVGGVSRGGPWSVVRRGSYGGDYNRWAERVK